MVKFRDQLRSLLKDKIPDELIPLLPSGFQAIDFAVILNLKEDLHEYSKLIGDTLLDLLPYVKSVWLRKGKISGKFRKPTGLIHICGIEDTEVEHRENNIKYKFDFTKIMFAKGNVSERKYLPELVQKGEIIVDMFAGIGYFSLAIAKFSSPKMIYSVELNPESFKYLVKNIGINKLDQKITPISGDSAIEVPKLSERGIKADRIIMGVFPAPYDFIKPASTVIKPEKLTIVSDLNEFQEQAKTKGKFDTYNRSDKPCSNTIIHFEGVTLGKRIDELFNKFETKLNELCFKVSLLAFRFVKSFGPKMWHLVLDLAAGL